MAGVNVTVRIDRETKQEFDEFCNNVGISITTAFNMFIRATLRTRELPFVVTDASVSGNARKSLGSLFKVMQGQSALNGTDDISLDEINDIISDCRQSVSVTI